MLAGCSARAIEERLAEAKSPKQILESDFEESFMIGIKKNKGEGMKVSQ